MITYDNSLFGFSLIFRVHGSAVWKASLPALFSTLGLLLYVLLSGNPIDDNEKIRVTEGMCVLNDTLARHQDFAKGETHLL